MLKKYLEQRHIDLDNGLSCLALGREYWQALEVPACEDDWKNWREFVYLSAPLQQTKCMPRS